VLRDDGMSYGDYVEQLTNLLFLKMAHENNSMLGKPSAIPAEISEDLKSALEQFEGLAGDLGSEE